MPTSRITHQRWSSLRSAANVTASRANCTIRSRIRSPRFPFRSKPPKPTSTSTVSKPATWSTNPSTRLAKAWMTPAAPCEPCVHRMWRIWDCGLPSKKLPSPPPRASTWIWSWVCKTLCLLSARMWSRPSSVSRRRRLKISPSTRRRKNSAFIFRTMEVPRSSFKTTAWVLIRDQTYPQVISV